MDFLLPKKIEKVKVPPIKCQGIKTKLVPFIAENLLWDGKGKWIEPFLGSGVVLFNILPDRALIADTNKHIIQFYKDIQNGEINEIIIKKYLEKHGHILYDKGDDYYYEMRNRFNESGGSLPFLFLNRSCFNGMMRFNSNGEFNVPFNHKLNRFRQAYVTKIVNQVSYVRKVMQNRDWTFEVLDWEETYHYVDAKDFVYLDPPYIGRHTDYYNTWSDDDAIRLAEQTLKLDAGFALSMWKKNKYRENEHIENYWNGLEEKTFSHFYHIGPSESLRNKMIEALAIKPGFTADGFSSKDENPRSHLRSEQISAFH